MKVAIIHDFLHEYGGAERVIEALHRIFPDAPIYVGFVDLHNFGSKQSTFSQYDLRTTFLQKIPFHVCLRSPLRVLAPAAFAHLDLSAYDLVISSSNAYHSKSVKIAAQAVHICYCHTPPRALYGFDASSTWKKNPISHFFGEIVNHFLRLVDFQAAQKVTQILVNSRVVQQRVLKCWRRESIVVYPPVALLDLVPVFAPAKQDFFLYVNRLNFAKHPELAVQACLQLDLQLIVVGSGPLIPELMQISQNNPKIKFVGSVNDSKLAQLYAEARAVLYPVIDEDFGIVPIEAMGFGTPVIAHRSGGPTETILENKTGIFFDDLNLDSLILAIQKFSKSSFDPQFIKEHAQQFNQECFAKKILQTIKNCQKTKLK